MIFLLFFINFVFVKAQWAPTDIPNPKVNPELCFVSSILQHDENHKSEIGGSNKNWICDPIGYLPQNVVIELNDKISKFEDRTTIEIALIIIDRLKEGITPEVFAVSVFNNWGVGKTTNNGILYALVVQDRKMYMKTGSGVADILTDLSIKAIFNKTKSYLRKGEFGMAVITVVDGIIDVLYPSKSPVTANLTNRRGTNSIALALASVFLTFTVIGCAWRYKSKRNKKILVNDKAFSQPSTNNLAAGALKPTYVRNSANEDFANKSNRRDEGIIQKNVIAVQNVLKDSSASKNVEAINENNRPLQGKEYPTQKISNKNEQSFVPKSKKVIDDNDLLEEQLKREAMAEDSNIVHSLVEREKNREIEDSIMYEYTKRKEEEEKKVEEEKIRRVIEAGERRKEIEEKERRRREMEKRKIAAEERRKVIEAEERRKEIEAEERKRKAIKEEERRKAIEAKEKKEREKEEKERQIDSSTKFIDSFGGGDCLEGGGVEDDW